MEETQQSSPSCASGGGQYQTSLSQSPSQQSSNLSSSLQSYLNRIRVATSALSADDVAAIFDPLPISPSLSLSSRSQGSMQGSDTTPSSHSSQLTRSSDSSQSRDATPLSSSLPSKQFGNPQTIQELRTSIIYLIKENEGYKNELNQREEERVKEEQKLYDEMRKLRRDKDNAVDAANAEIIKCREELSRLQSRTEEELVLMRRRQRDSDTDTVLKQYLLLSSDLSSLKLHSIAYDTIQNQPSSQRLLVDELRWRYTNEYHLYEKQFNNYKNEIQHLKNELRNFHNMKSTSINDNNKGETEGSNVCIETKCQHVTLLHTVQSKLDLTTADVTYLRSQLHDFERQNVQWKNKLDRKKHKIHYLKEQLEKLSSSLTNRITSLNNNSNNNDSKSIGSSYTSDFHDFKSILTESYNRDLLHHEQENQRLSLALQTIQYKYDDLQTQVLLTAEKKRQSDVDHATTVNELRSALKIRTMDYERLSLNYESSMAALESEKHMNNVLQQKLQVLTTEYYRLDCQGSKQVMALTEAVQSFRDKLRVYETMEQDFDQCLTLFTKSQTNTNENSNQNNKKDDDMLSNLSSIIPLDGRRKLRQTLLLVKECNTLSEANSRLTEELSQLKQNQAQWDEKTALLQVEIGKMARALEDKFNGQNQPTHEKELKKEVSRLKQKLHIAKNDIKLLLSQSADLDSLRTLLQSTSQSKPQSISTVVA